MRPTRLRTSLDVSAPLAQNAQVFYHARVATLCRPSTPLPGRDSLTIHPPFDSTGPAPVTKRTVPGPRDGFTLENVNTEILTAVPYDIVREGIKY